MNKYTILALLLPGSLHANPTSWGDSDYFGILLLLGFWAVILLLGLISATVEYVKERLSTIPGPFIFLVLILFLVSLFLIFIENPKPTKNKLNKQITYQPSVLSSDQDYDPIYWHILKPSHGLHMGRVEMKDGPTNDSISLLINEQNCGLEEPFIFLTLTSKVLKGNYDGVDIASLEGQSITLNLNFDKKYPIGLVSSIGTVKKFQNGGFLVLNLSSLYEDFLGLDEKYDNFLGWQEVNIKVAPNDPNKDLFNIPSGRNFNMTGFRALAGELIENCKKSIKAK